MTLSTVQSVDFYRIPVPDAENAFPLWRAAAEAAVPIEVDEAACGAEACSWGAADEAPVPSQEEEHRRRDAVQKNHRALELIDAGVDRGRLQVPVIARPEDWDVGLGLIRTWGTLSRVRTWRIEKSLDVGDFQEAVRDAIALVRVGDMASNAGGIFVHYLMGVSLRRFATDALCLLARHRLPRHHYLELLEAVRLSARSSDGLQEAIVADFHLTQLPLVERLPESGSTEQLVDALLANFYCGEPCGLGPGPIQDLESRLTWRRERLLQILDGHSGPFDKAATISQMQQRVADGIGELESPWAVRLFDVAGHVREWRRGRNTYRRRWLGEEWPFQLNPVCPVEELGESQEVCRSLAELAAAVGRRRSMFLPVSDSVVPRLRRRIRGVRNIVGLLVSEHNAPLEARSFMFRHRLYLTACQAMLAIRVFQTDEGRAPASLSELVDRGIIAELPCDPYVDRTLRYSRQRMLLWSVGEDRRNRRGDLDYTPFPGHRVRWQVPAPYQLKHET